MFAPCNIPLSRLIARCEENKQRTHERLKQAMSRNAIKPHAAQQIEREEAAVLVALKRLADIEQQHPELLEEPQ